MQNMDYNTDSARETLTNDKVFGKPLKNDRNFYLKSPQTPVYNCIAFAMGMRDRWVDCASHPWHWWPPVCKGTSISCLIEAFKYLGFEECGMEDSFEPDYDKVALYEKDSEWKHAAKIVDEGIYHSKFGESYDGTHSRGDVLKLKYGNPYIIMRRKKEDAHLTQDRIGNATGVMYTNKKLVIGTYEDYIVFYDGKTFLGRAGKQIRFHTDGKIEILS